MFDKIAETNRIHLINCENSGNIPKIIGNPPRFLFMKPMTFRIVAPRYHWSVYWTWWWRTPIRNEAPQQGNSKGRSKRGPRFDPWKSSQKIDWLVVEPTYLKNMLVKLDYFPKVGMKIKNIWVATNQLSILVDGGCDCGRGSCLALFVLFLLVLWVCGCKFAGLVLPVVVDAVHR